MGRGEGRLGLGKKNQEEKRGNENMQEVNVIENNEE